MLQCPGSSWGFGALLKGTSVVVYADFTQPPFWNRKRGSIAFNHRSSGHIVVFQAVHPINEKSVIKSCNFIAFRLLLLLFFFYKTAHGIRHPSSAHFSTSAILNRGSSSRLVVQVIVVYLYFRVSSHRSLAFDFKMAAAWNRRIWRVEREHCTFIPPHLQFLPARVSNSQPFNYKSDSLTIRPQLPPFLTWILI